MSDIEIIKDKTGEFMLFEARSDTEEGIEFLDAYIPRHEYSVIDSGRLIMREEDQPAFVEAVQAAGLSVG